MKTIKHNYGADLDWVGAFAKKLEGKVEGNFMIVPDKIHSGIRYFLDCGEDIVAMYIDVLYNSDIHFIQKNIKKDFIGIYYNLNDGDATLSSTNFIQDVGRWHYNLAVIDSSLESDYYVKAGSKTFALCIFIKKSIIESFAKDNNIFLRNRNKLMDSTKNTFIRFDRMTVESQIILGDLRKLEVGGAIFDINLIGAVHLLIAEYLNKMSKESSTIQSVNESDLSKIIWIKTLLVDGVEDHFPSIKLMAQMVNMSESKFKTLFKKITGTTSNAFFMHHKLLRSKELLEKGKPISQISLRLKYSSISYFSSQFKSHFGASPSGFIKKI